MVEELEHNSLEEESQSGFFEAAEGGEVGRGGGFSLLSRVAEGRVCRIVKGMRYGRWWCLKCLREEWRGDGMYEGLLRKEFEIGVGMQHAGIVGVSGIEDVAGLGTCIVMEWVDGVTLDVWLGDGQGGVENGGGYERGERGISENGGGYERGERGALGRGVKRGRSERLEVFLRLLEAVEYVHSRQVVHRDLKPGNIMVTRNGNGVKLIDFGLSDTDQHMVLKQAAGTVGYISPEQLGGGEPDVRNDVFSLGCVLRDMRLGWFMGFVVRRCCGGIEGRYANVGELRRAVLKAAGALQRICRVAAVVVGLVVAGYYGGGVAGIGGEAGETGAGVGTVAEGSGEGVWAAFEGTGEAGGGVRGNEGNAVGAGSGTLRGGALGSGVESGGALRGGVEGGGRGGDVGVRGGSGEGTRGAQRVSLDSLVACGKRIVDERVGEFEARMDTASRQRFLMKELEEMLEGVNVAVGEYAEELETSGVVGRREAGDVRNRVLLHFSERARGVAERFARLPE